MAISAKKTSLQITTVRLPQTLYDEARRVLQKGETEATSLNDLLIDSLREKLRQVKRSQIDAAFAGMRSDEKYQREAQKMASEFAANDADTLKRAVKGS